jgi:NTE family protein
MTDDFDLVLALGGGNALGAFQAGAYQALHEHELMPRWIVGASIGAINGAMIAGSEPRSRIDALRTLWRPGGDYGSLSPMLDTSRRTAAVAWTLIAGRPGMFGASFPGVRSWDDHRISLFETDQLVTTLDRMVDFDRLNEGPCRFTATAVDLATGEDVAFDTRAGKIDARHIRASAALPVTFPPVEIDGQWLVDGGMSANLPLDPIMSERTSRPRIVLAIDLLPLRQELPRDMGEAAGRMQDLIFAAQSRRTIARWQSVYEGDRDANITLVRLVYSDQSDEIAGKALDFSGQTIARRWDAGYRSMMRLVDRLGAGELRPEGFRIIESG